MSIPRHGIYHGLPFADYLAIDAISNSALALLPKVENRLNVLRHIVAELEQSERNVLVEWLTESEV